MNCPNCNTYVESSAKFCPSCGAKLESQPFTIDYSYIKRNELAEQVQLFGILSLVLTISTTFIGFVLAIVTLYKASSYRTEFGYLDGKAQTGRTLALVSVILGAVTLFIFAAMFFIWFILLLMAV